MVSLKKAAVVVGGAKAWEEASLLLKFSGLSRFGLGTRENRPARVAAQ